MKCCKLHENNKYLHWPCGEYSKEKRSKLHKDKKNKCPNCGNIKSFYSPECIFCSAKKRALRRVGIPLPQWWKDKISESQKGDKGNNWRGGKTNKNKTLRQSAKFKDWRKLVFERDNYTCQECGKNKCIIHPHHIKLLSEYPEFALDVSNGITLCYTCHMRRHPQIKLSCKT